MTRPTTARRGTAAAIAAVPLGVVIGLVQAAIWAGFLHTRRQGSGDGADRGFSSGPSLATEFGWLLTMLVVSVALLMIVLPLLRIRRWALLVLPVLVVEFLLAGWLGTTLPGHSDWRSLVLAVVLAIELLSCRLVFGRRAARPPSKDGQQR
jgi:hypothetical protein